MIELNPFFQSEAMCGPASLKIMLAHYGKNFSEEELAALCDSTIDKGTSHRGLVKGAKKLGFSVIEKENATLEELSRFIQQSTPVILGWWSTNENHYSVAYGIDEESIYLMDPEEEGGKVAMKITDFNEVWHDFDSARGVEVNHWMMAILPQEATA